MAEPITLAEAKDHLRMADDNSQDTFITSLIAPARAMVERITGVLFVEGERTATFTRWGDLLLWRRPIVSIDEIVYTTTDDSADDEAYTGFIANVGDYPVRITAADGGDFPELIDGATITVTYTAGAIATTSEEYLIGRRAMFLLIGHWFESRESVVIGDSANEVPMAAQWLMDELRPISAY